MDWRGIPHLYSPLLILPQRMGAERLGDQEKLSIDPGTKLVGSANEEQIVINGHPVTALLDTGSQITHVSKAFCQAKGIQINPSNHLVEIEGSAGDSIKCVGYNEAKLNLPLGFQTFEIEALLLVLPSTDYQKWVPVAIGTTITDMVVEFISQNNPENVSKSWKAVCCATQSNGWCRHNLKINTLLGLPNELLCLPSQPLQ